MSERELTKVEKSILLYAESCLIDNYGKMAQRRMNQEDFDALDAFRKEGLLDYGRLPAKEIQESHLFAANTHWVRFSADAWKIAHQLRRERSERMCTMKYRSMRNLNV